MQNFYSKANPITIVAPADVSSGGLVIAGGIVGVAQTDADSGDDVAIVTEGVFEFDKVSAQAWTLGASIYAHQNTDLSYTMTTSSSGNTLIGKAVKAAANPSSSGFVRIFN